MGKKKKKNKSHLPFRLNVLFFAVFVLFSALILQLGVIQILYGEDAQEEINKTTSQTTAVPVPRGKMYDRYGNILADTKPQYTITYTPTRTPKPDFHVKLAEQLAQLIDMNEEDIKKVTERDKKDYWIITNKNAHKERLSKEEQTYTEEEEEAEEETPYEILLSRIDPEKDLQYSDEELEVIAIKRKLDQASAFTPFNVKDEKVTQEEYALVAEHQHELSGINVATDWERTYPEDKLLKDYLGKVTTEGVPKEQEQYFTSRNYNKNDRVGSSGLEKEYEAVLKGEKKKIQYTTNRSGDIVEEEIVHKGKQGNDLMLTLDMELQKRMDESLRKHIKATRAKSSANRFVYQGMAVAMNPKTGEILGISGQTWDEEEEEFYDTGINAVTAPVAPGSAIKGATVLAGYDFGVLQPGESIYDAPLDIKGSPPLRSYQALGSVNDLSALERSSNVYMYHIAMRIGGDESYQPGESFSFIPERLQVFRNYYAQFGLGVKTGIDLPAEAESAGFKNKNDAASMLYQSIGQSDTYTTMQLAQYVSTIANDGYRVQPRLVNEVRQPKISKQGEQIGPVVEAYDTNVLNRITMEDSEIERVQQGFYRVFNGSRGTARHKFANKDYTAAGKTGTAQVDYYERKEDKNGEVYYKPHRDMENLTLVGYAPYEDPEIAFAVVVPYTGSVTGQYNVEDEIGSDILDSYFELKEERASGNTQNEEEQDEKENEFE
ncbi:peptidoglycan D,D-transpeptidase FtsI family protein [Pontibacillus litoralis]|uniref:serine-type D-Ala-D-Ala carboxypeptidase n=1 Tax=Pontibacillus litoralis JSM 072002 TaxID=1385512 RepID=A0A0A5G342_9BACI|nr:penicillin-binding protein 2 [Pontibacillus litoralis]KGX87511.1 hypothetical protein N784_14795 [Pontibacillus litoralis JSM 072002]